MTWVHKSYAWCKPRRIRSERCKFVNVLRNLSHFRDWLHHTLRLPWVCSRVLFRWTLWLSCVCGVEGDEQMKAPPFLIFNNEMNLFLVQEEVWWGLLALVFNSTGAVASSWTRMWGIHTKTPHVALWTLPGIYNGLYLQRHWREWVVEPCPFLWLRTVKRLHLFCFFTCNCLLTLPLSLLSSESQRSV